MKCNYEESKSPLKIYILPALGNSGSLNKIEIKLRKVNKEINYPQATLRKGQCFPFKLGHNITIIKDNSFFKSSLSL